MDNQNQVQQPIPTVNPVSPPQFAKPIISATPSPSLPSISSGKSKTMFILTIIILLLCIMGGSFYLLKVKTTKNTSPNTIQIASVSPSPTFEPTAIPTLIPTIQTENTLPSDWVVKNSVTCAIKIPLPPNQSPYIEKTGDITWSWQFQEGKGDQLFDLSFENAASAEYFNDKGLGSGQVMGIVSVNCSPNKQQYTTQTYADFISNSIKKRDFYKGENIVCQPIQTQQTLWSKKIIVLTSNCKTEAKTLILDELNDTYYIFINENKTYLIQKLSESSNQFVKETTDKIFNNLQFSN